MPLLLRNIVKLQKPEKKEERETATLSPASSSQEKTGITSTSKILMFSAVFLGVGFIFGFKLHPPAKPVVVSSVPQNIAKKAQMYDTFLNLYNSLSPENKEKMNHLMRGEKQ